MVISGYKKEESYVFIDLHGAFLNFVVYFIS